MTTTAATHILSEPTRAVRVRTDAPSRTVTGADQAYLHEAINSVSWERRGPLQRLTRRA